MFEADDVGIGFGPAGEGYGGYERGDRVSERTRSCHVQSEIQHEPRLIGQENKSMSTELNDLRITSARLESEGKDATITIDSYKDKINDLQRDIDEQKAKIEDLKKVQHREKEEEKEKRKQEMLNEMMSKIDMVSY